MDFKIDYNDFSINFEKTVDYKTAIYLSVFGDKGYWADSDYGGNLRAFLKRGKIRDSDIGDIDHYIKNSLSWFVRNGILDDIKTSISITDNRVLQIQIEMKIGNEVDTDIINVLLK